MVSSTASTHQWFPLASLFTIRNTSGLRCTRRTQPWLIDAGTQLTVRTATTHHWGLTDLFDRSVTLLLRNTSLADTHPPSKHSNSSVSKDAQPHAPPSKWPTVVHPCLPQGFEGVYRRVWPGVAAGEDAQHAEVLTSESVRLQGTQRSREMRQQCRATIRQLLQSHDSTCPVNNTCGAPPPALCSFHAFCGMCLPWMRLDLCKAAGKRSTS